MTTNCVASPPPLAHAISGSLGSALALLVFYPLERIRTELQSSAIIPSSHPSLPPIIESDDHQDAGDNPEEQQQQEVLPSLQHRNVTAEVSAMSDLSPTSSRGSSNSNDSWIACHNDGEDELTVPYNNCESEITTPDIGSTPNVVLCDPSTQNESLLMCWRRLQANGDLYRGVGPVVTTLAISNFVFFFVHQVLKQFESKIQKSMWQALITSSLAGVVNVLTTNPLWVATLRIMKRSQYSNGSLLLEMLAISEKEGLASLWNGTSSSLLLVSNPVIQFFCYEQIKQLLVVRRQQQQHQISKPHFKNAQLPPLEAFLLGAFAKAIATILTYPLQLSQVLLRLQGGDSDKVTKASPDKGVPYTSTLHCLRHLIQSKGIPALYTGIDAKMLQTCLTAALTFCTYEQLLRAVQRLLPM